MATGAIGILHQSGFAKFKAMNRVFFVAVGSVKPSHWL
jgi:hypothetical protein